MKSLLYMFLLINLVFFYSGCTTTEKHTGAGGVGGGVIGAAVGHNFGDGAGDRDKGALIGAVVGALVENQLGRQAQQQQNMQNQIQYLQDKQSSNIIWITNSNGSKTPVKFVHAQGGQWIGPRGEYDDSIPDQKTLTNVYGS